MQLLTTLGAGLCLVALSFAFGTAAPPQASLPPVAEGHDVLVVQGDRDALAITHVAHKADPWGGVPKGFASDWRLVIRDAGGAVLAEVPLDVTPFATDALAKGAPRRVEGCVVVDSRIAMLVNAPTFRGAASYEFLRGDTSLSRIAAAEVRRLAGGGR